MFDLDSLKAYEKRVHIAVFNGAGVPAERGIPTFRDTQTDCGNSSIQQYPVLTRQISCATSEETLYQGYFVIRSTSLIFSGRSIISMDRMKEVQFPVILPTQR